MGEGIQRARAKQFKHRASKSKAAVLDAENLFSRFQEVFRRIFKCKFVDGHGPLSVGDLVYLVDQGEPLVRVLLDNTVVGHVDDAGTKDLRASVFSIDDTRGIVVAEVKSIAELTDTFTVALKQPPNQ